ncbi:unnamed protein product [Mytilus coruscus]|uniref:Uncharacterized protein n=1 Tax=Mytilus coruscus TaxID=42192 RepID=A0A6J8BZC5_MYTCO|nr:unnamed protein product [Mytilus coruscus]
MSWVYQSFFKVVNPPILIQDLEEDPFINNALTNTCCELYYRYGMYLAPFTAILTTARHIVEPLASLDFRKKDENNDIKMMNENPEQKENKEEKKKYLKTQTKKTQKRVAAGKKGAEYIKMTTQKDGKQIANMLYHAGVETLLTVGYAEIGKKVLRRPAPKVDFNVNDVVMLSIDILLAMATKDMLIKQGIIPADIMK